jgi:oligoribonuclease NrnB/cAMP/cGMP phosphodiesterase (DHH superfamily)
MLDTKELNELKEHFEKAQNPIVLYDNDADGLCSYILFRRAFGKGKGVAIRSYPDLNSTYTSRVKEFNSDYVFIFDKPVISEEFIKEISQMHIPIVWVDHHNVEQKWDKEDYSNVSIFNPALAKNPSSEPTTYLVHKAIGKKDDVWIAMMGCISDCYLPEFSKSFSKDYPEMWGNIKNAFDVYYKTEIGKAARALNFGLKDSITHIVQLQNFLINCKSPGDIFSEVKENQAFREKNTEIMKKYLVLLEKAKEQVDGKVVFFEYGGDMSISADLSNELSYLYPGKYILVAYKKGGIANISIRGKGVREILSKILGEFESASGGGHNDAVGARVRVVDIERFKERFIENIKKN